jgi:enoyl-CoA hydratase/carnithine racemase
VSNPPALISCSRDGAVATVTLERPDRRNALSSALLMELSRTLRAMTDGASPAPAVLILTGRPPSFCAGADMREACWTDPAARSARRDVFRQVVDFFHACPFATLAAVEGHALGGGLELALACDLVVAGESAVFGLPELGVGAIPGGGGVHSLVRRAGQGLAADLLLTGRRATAAELLAAGAVTRVVPNGTALPEAVRLATGMLAHHELLPLAVRLLRDSAHLSRADALAVEEGYFWRAALRPAD